MLSGGNIDTRLLASVLMRELVRDGRIVRLRRRISDDRRASSPGSPTIIGKAGGNIVEVQHSRLFGGVVAKAADLDVTIETRDRAAYRRAGRRPAGRRLHGACAGGRGG